MIERLEEMIFRCDIHGDINSICKKLHKEHYKKGQRNEWEGNLVVNLEVVKMMMMMMMTTTMMMLVITLLTMMEEVTLKKNMMITKSERWNG